MALLRAGCSVFLKLGLLWKALAWGSGMHSGPPVDSSLFLAL
jgi:hypothetical protein